MQIIKTELVEATMPKDDPKWRFAYGGEATTPGWVLKLDTDAGITGIGYSAAATHHGETLGTMRAVLEQLYLPMLTGQSPFDMERLLFQMDRTAPQNRRALTAVDLGLHDLVGKALGQPVYNLLGGLVRTEIPVNRIVALKTPQEMAGNALKLVEQGYRYLKIKIGADPQIDVQRLKAIRQAVGDEVTITVDVNQGYSTAKVAIEAIKRLEECGILLVEQPVRRDDFDGLAAVTAAVDCLVEADESASSLEDVFKLVQRKAVDCISIKVPKLGGLRNCKKAMAICQAGNVLCRIGAAVGSRIFALANMHLVASTENVFSALEGGEFARLLNDPAEGIEVENGLLRVPQGHGLGIILKDAS